MAYMRKIEKPSPTESPLLFEFDPTKPAEEMLTALEAYPWWCKPFVLWDLLNDQKAGSRSGSPSHQLAFRLPSTVAPTLRTDWG
jgi:hypothetical protein